MRKIKIISSLILSVLLFAGCEVFYEPFGTSSSPEESSVSVVSGVDSVPDYSGQAYVEINGNVPYFTDSDMTTRSFESYGELDEYGRCTAAYACVGIETMPTEKRGSIGSVKPSGWQTVKYDFIDGHYLYNRCHLIGYQLTAENANPNNLITGTRYLNIEGMLPFENMVADYIKETKYHVLYRVTPVFDCENAVARGVEIEAYSVEDLGEGVCFNIFAYNVQPGVMIDYRNGESSISESEIDNIVREYVINTKSKKYHLAACEYAEQISESNRKEFKGTAKELKELGYKPCGVCIEQ